MPERNAYGSSRHTRAAGFATTSSWGVACAVAATLSNRAFASTTCGAETMYLTSTAGHGASSLGAERATITSQPVAHINCGTTFAAIAQRRPRASARTVSAAE